MWITSLGYLGGFIPLEVEGRYDPSRVLTGLSLRVGWSKIILGFIRIDIRIRIRMADKSYDQRNIRKITKVGQTSLAVTLPKDFVRKLGWKERQKVVVKKIRGGVQIKDWKK